jgi:heme/copper-type cytochrome/quinol oxidase subunit 1
VTPRPLPTRNPYPADIPRLDHVNVAFMPRHEIIEAVAATTAMTPWQAIALFGGIPLTVCAIVTLAVYLPDWRRSRAKPYQPMNGQPINRQTTNRQPPSDEAESESEPSD